MNREPAAQPVSRLADLIGSLRWRLVVAVLLLLLCINFCIDVAAVVAESTTAIVTGTERVFVRRGPGNEFPPFASIPSGSTVEVQEMVGEWARIITASGQVGYINSSFLALPGESERHLPTARPTVTRTGAPRPTWTHPLLTPTPAPPTRTRRPTGTRPPSPTYTETRPASPTRTATETRPPTATRTPKLTTTPRSTVTLTATSSPTATLTPAVKEPPVVRTANQRSGELEAEITALRRELADLRSHGNSIPVAAAALPDGCSEHVRTEIARLAVAVENLQRRLNGDGIVSQERVTGAAAVSATATDSHVVSPLAVFLGAVGLVFGWGLGSSYVRRRDRSRRSRLRF